MRALELRITEIVKAIAIVFVIRYAKYCSCWKILKHCTLRTYCVIYAVRWCYYSWVLLLLALKCRSIFVILVPNLLYCVPSTFWTVLWLTTKNYSHQLFCPLRLFCCSKCLSSHWLLMLFSYYNRGNIPSCLNMTRRQTDEQFTIHCMPFPQLTMFRHVHGRKSS